jgi:hypothetical protein
MMPVACTLSPGADLPPCDSRIAELYQYWLSLRPVADVLPGRQHFDPTDIPRLLPWIMLVDVERDPLRFKHRLVGTENVRVKGYDATGQYLDDRVPDFADTPTYPQWLATAEHGQVAYHRGLPVRHVPKDYIESERLLLPLARNGRVVDMVLLLAVFRVHSASTKDLDRVALVTRK